MARVQALLGVPERRACQVIGQARTTRRRSPKVKHDEPRPVARISELACQFGRYGYRRTTALLRGEGWWVNRTLRSEQVLEVLGELFVQGGVPAYIRPDHGPEYTCLAVRDWLSRVRVQTLFIEPGSPWEKGYNNSFNGKLRDELLNGEISCTLNEARALIEWYRPEYNCIRLHSTLGYRAPAPEATRPCGAGSAPLRQPRRGAPALVLAGA